MDDSGVPPFQETFIMYIMCVYIYTYIINTIPITTDEIGSLTFEAPTSGGALFTPL